MTVFDGCSDSCGWTAACIALVCAGTYGVPIKETAHFTQDVNPLVFQSFKTMVFFLLSFHGVLFLDVPLRFTYWGILSGGLWVMGGTGGVVAVRYAGMAVAVGTWASVMICVNFVWGILIFHEPVYNLHSTMAAFVLLGVGLWGMSIYGAPTATANPALTMTKSASTSVAATGGLHSTVEENHDNGEATVSTLARTKPCTRASSLGSSSTSDEEQQQKSTSETGGPHKKSSTTFRRTAFKANAQNISFSKHMDDDESDESYPLVVKPMEIDTNNNHNTTGGMSQPLLPSTVSPSPSSPTTTTTTMAIPDTHVRLGGNLVLRKRTVGILAALFNGCMSGSALIPMHFAKRTGLGGEYFMVSYGCGALLSNLCLWALYFSVLVVRQALLRKRELPAPSSSIHCSNNNPTTSNDNSKQRMFSGPSILRQASEAMPEWHVWLLWKPALAAGLLNALGMIGSVVSVTYLGQGIGNSVIQAKIIVSGMWGIFYYREISHPRAIRNWFLSASLSVAGIVWLSRERILATQSVVVK